MSESPDNTGKIEEKELIRDEKGRIAKGSASLNPAGKPKGTRHLTTLLEEALKKLAEGSKETYEAMLVKRVLLNAIKKGDMKAIEHIWDRIEGKAPQNIDVTSGGKELPVPIMQGVIKTNAIPSDNSNTKDIESEQED